MPDWTLSKTRLHAGVYEGVLAGSGEPKLEVSSPEGPIDDVTFEPQGEGLWHVAIRLPATAIADGITIVTIAEPGSGEVLATVPVLAGDSAESDLRGEIALLRAELQLLKRAFRRYVSGANDASS